MIQKTGGGHYIDHGPAAAIHSRHRVPGGVSVSQAIAPKLDIRGLGSGPKGTGGSIMPTHWTLPELAEARKFKARAAYQLFKLKHSACDCHETYGGQPRPVGYRAREKDRMALRREMGLKK